MADVFAAIASNDIKAKRGELIKQVPENFCGNYFDLNDENKTVTKVYKKMSTKKELDKEISKLRKHYNPFLKDYVDHTDSIRKIEYINEFDFRIKTNEDSKNFFDVLMGKGDWEKVTIPHYDAPVGRNTTYYRTTISFDAIDTNKTYYIHFDGVDYIAKVFINGAFVGEHEGFFAPFEFDISEYVHAGENTLLVVVENDYVYSGNNAPTYENERLEGNKLYAATGIGFDDPYSGWHHCPPGMGIYQKVSIEVRDKVYISDLWVRPKLFEKEIEVWCEIYNTNYRHVKDISLSFSLFGKNFKKTVFKNKAFKPLVLTNVDDGRIICDGKVYDNAKEAELFVNQNLFRFVIKLDDFKIWTLDKPYLYTLKAELLKNGNVIDNSNTSFGMRSFTMDKKDGKNGMFYLNGIDLRLRGANTMGYEQLDVYRNDKEQLIYDMLMAKACNMNFLRITQRPVQKEIYQMCDCLGILVQTDLPLFTNIRRTKFGEVVRQAEEMEKLIRPYASTVLITYINEPFANANGKPHRHFIRSEMESLFVACDNTVKLLNPDVVIKHIDGDYDPPSTDMPDYHTYTMWYNGHGIEMGKVHRGYWLDLPKDWYCGCGEFGSEGLEDVDFMKKHYPSEWLPQNSDEEKNWDPSKIVGSQSGNMSYFFFDRPNTLKEWVTRSQEHQAFGTKIQTEAFRRNKNMTTFAIHLFIDAWPAGWMKTIVDSDRNPKKAFFVYRDALTPLMVNIRTDRFSYFDNETGEAEIWICNDTKQLSNGHTVTLELIDDKKFISSTSFKAEFSDNSSFMQGKARFALPKATKRKDVILRAILKDENDNVIHYYDQKLTVFEKENINASKDFIYIKDYNEYKKSEKEILKRVKNGANLILEFNENGTFDLAGSKITVKNCGMRALNFVSCSTNHKLTKGYKINDFSYWYDDKLDMISPLISKTFLCDNMNEVLTTGNALTGSAWGKPIYKALALSEKKYGKGHIFASVLKLDDHMLNPVAKTFYKKMISF